MRRAVPRVRRGGARRQLEEDVRGADGEEQPGDLPAAQVRWVLHVELQTKVAEDYAKFYNHGEGPYYGLLLVGAFTFKRLIRGHSHITSAAITRQGQSEY